MLLNLFVMSVEFAGGSVTAARRPVSLVAGVAMCGRTRRSRLSLCCLSSLHALHDRAHPPPSGSHPVIILLECLINLFIIAEVSIGIYAAGRSYFSSVMNCVDCALAVLCLGFFLVLVGTDGGGEYSGIFELDALLLACRFLFQVLRLSVLAYRSRQVAMMQNQEEVDFNAVSLEACVDSRFGGRRSRAHSHSHSHSFNVAALGPDAHGVGAALDVGLDTPDGGGGGRDGSSGSDGVVFTPTSYIHLKPSIFLELQNARAFADPPSITVPGGAAESNEFALRSVDSVGDGGDSVNSSSHFVPGYGMSPSPLGSPNVPVLTPPPLSLPHDESRRSTPALSAPASPTAASSSDPHSESASVSNSSLSTTRSLHPLLAHDSEEMDDEHLDLQLL